MNAHSGFETKVLTGFIAAVLVVVALAAATWKLAQDATEETHKVGHTHEVLNNLAQAKAQTLQVELSTQNFRISGNAHHLPERDAAMAARETILSRIKALTADNPYQQEHWEQLRAVIDQRIAISREVQRLRATLGAEAANAYVASAPLQETRERTHRLMREMEDEENRLLASRSAEQQRSRQFLAIASPIAALSLALLLVATYFLIRRQLRESEVSQNALAGSEERLAITLHSIGDGVLATDAEGRITQLNPVAERLTGWSSAEAQGQPVDAVFRIIHETTRAPALVPVTKVLETGQIQELANHTALIARDGREHPIADSAAPIRDAAGQIRGVVLVFRDVSTERQAQRLIVEQNEALEQRVRERTEQLRESEEHLRSVIGSVPALIAFVDAQQRYVYVNEQYRTRFAPERHDITGCTVRDILGEERYAIAAPLIAGVLAGHAQSYDWQPFPDVWQVVSYMPRRDAQGMVSGYYVLGVDITERKAAEAKIQTLNASLAQHLKDLEHASRALRTLSAGNRTMLRATDEQELLDSMCQAIVTTGGYDTAIVWYRCDDATHSLQPMAEHGYPGGLTALRRLPTTWAENQRGRGAVATAIRTGQTSVAADIHHNPDYQPWTTSLSDYASVIACPLEVGGKTIGALAIYDGEPNTFGPDESALLTESGDDLAFGIATLRARAEQQKNREAMFRLTHFDPLTGLPNATRFTEAITAALDASHGPPEPFAMLQANVERLSQINDALGFSHGDQLLREFGMRLHSAMPASATVARLRGDEFAILLPASDEAVGMEAVRRLEMTIARPFRIADIALDVTAKIGIALFPQHGTTPHDLYRHMDIAVHQAKEKGLRHVMFNPAQTPDQARRLTIASELRRAIDGGDLRLYLQPKVDMVTGRVCGSEGLVRWQHATRGLIYPGEFIDLAESTGLIKPLTEWVIEAALSLNRGWAREGRALPIAVNLSARNLHDDELLTKIRQLHKALDVAPGLLEVELTESTVMEDAGFALQVLHDLRDDGIPLYIDDFGTGYSSLRYLQKLPVDYIKIDQSFVRHMSTHKDAALIVRSTIDLIHDLGRKAVAEGIETQQDWDQLALLGCDMAQGYLIAKPMPAEEFPAWVERFRPPETSGGPPS